ncbi:hypothetical protein MLD38_012827 [Melastoma candidum]|uniref:Uncharacterized protein n=1 Tax=Melastoma candidum TaxID=119954 RepID=A0ACB9R8Q1_9MYRT|nr:hypothetical protein MLD38_012827 [Melastoma candidum]
MSVDWAHLPGDLLCAISERLLLYADHVRFRAVCPGWRFSVPAIPRHLPPQPPWLLLPLYQPYYFSSSSPSSNCFYNFLDNSVNKLGHLSPLVPELSPYSRRCGSSHGWLVVLDYSPRIVLFNPLMNSKINLPDLTTFPNVVSVCFANIGKEYIVRRGRGDPTTSVQDMRDMFVKKVVLSNSPGMDSEFVALAILDTSGDLVYCRRRDDCWKDLIVGDSQFEDVIFHDGSFYCVDRSGGVAICDLSGDSPVVSRVTARVMHRGDAQYLVTVGEDLVLVVRFLEFGEVEDRSGSKTSSFESFRLDWGSNEPRWDPIDSLGDFAVFIGTNSSFSIRAADFPGCVGDRIYFTEDYSEGLAPEHISGTYSLRDRRVEFLCFRGYDCVPAPIWLSPNPC